MNTLPFTQEMIQKQIIAFPNKNRIQFLRKSSHWSHECTLLNYTFQSLLPQSHLVAPSKEMHFYLPRIIREGKFTFGGVVKRIQGITTNDSFRNCIELMKSNDIVQIVCGFSLSDDGLFRLDFWGVDRNGILVETREKKILYFG